MTAQTFSDALGEISEKYIMEAIAYEGKPTRWADHPIRYRVAQAAACILLAALLSGCTVLAISPEARAAFVGWVRELYETYFEYHYVGENQNTLEDIVYQPTWVPDGYEMTSEIHYPGGGDITYRKEDEGMVGFSWSKDIESSLFQIYPETAEIKKTFVRDCPADLYLEHGEDLSGALVWTNQEEGIILAITATLGEDEIIKIAESVEAKNLDFGGNDS